MLKEVPIILSILYFSSNTWSLKFKWGILEKNVLLWHLGHIIPIESFLSKEEVNFKMELVLNTLKYH